MNKINYKFIAVAVVLIGAFSSCYKDKSSLATDPITEISVDTAGIAPEQFVDYQGHLILKPKLDPKFQAANLSYKWQITEKAEDKSTKLETIGNELQLDYLATKPISSKPYYLFLTVTDNDNDGLEYIYSWPLTIRGAFISGLVVADTKDNGQNTDLTYIKGKSISIKYNGDEIYFRDLLGKTPQGRIPGKVKKLAYAYWGRAFFGRDSYLWASTDDGKLFKYSTKDFQLVGDLSSEKVVIYKPSGNFKINNHFSAGEYYFLDSSDGLYRNSHITKGVETVFSVPDAALAGVKISNDVVGVSGNRLSRDGFAVYYDEVAGAIRGFAKYQSYQFHKETFQRNNQFDPEKLPGYSAVAADMTDKAQYSRILLKEKQSGKYELYTLKTHVAEQKDYRTGAIIQQEERAVAQSKYSVAEEGKAILDKARSVFFSKKQDLFYAVTADKIYAFTYGTGSELKPSEALYTVSGGETISSGKLFIQGEYNFEPTYVGMSILPKLDYNCMALILCIQKGAGEGIVRILPIDPDFATSGKLLPNKAYDYTGFGTVLDATPIGE